MKFALRVSGSGCAQIEVFTELHDKCLIKILQFSFNLAKLISSSGLKYYKNA